MTPAYFLDSSFALALISANDQAHRRASDYWTAHTGTMPDLVTTSFVACEIAAFLQNRGQHSRAVQLVGWIMQADNIRLEHVDDALFGEGWLQLVRQQDEKYSLTDCVSFALMRRLGLTTALTFDHHFARAGFLTLP